MTTPTKRRMPRPANPDEDPSLQAGAQPIKTREIVRLKPDRLAELRKNIAAGQFDDKERAGYWLEVFRDA